MEITTTMPEEVVVLDGAHLIVQVLVETVVVETAVQSLEQVQIPWLSSCSQ